MDDAFVLDAWALLAFFQREEPAASRVKTLLEAALSGQTSLLMSIINLGEVYYRIGKVRGRSEADETLEAVRRLPVTFVPASDDLVMAAARLKMRFAISYADAFAAALARQSGAILLTGDLELLTLTADLRLEALQRD